MSKSGDFQSIIRHKVATPSKIVTQHIMVVSQSSLSCKYSDVNKKAYLRMQSLTRDHTAAQIISVAYNLDCLSCHKISIALCSSYWTTTKGNRISSCQNLTRMQSIISTKLKEFSIILHSHLPTWVIGVYIPSRSMAIFKPAFEPWVNSSSYLIEPFAPPVLVLTSYVPASCHLRYKGKS
jgi:hypothetical protein